MAGAVNMVPPPPPTIVSITRLGSTSTILFTTTNGAIYSLYYNIDTAVGLNQPVSSWSVSGSTVTGAGLVDQFSDVSTEPNRLF